MANARKVAPPAADYALLVTAWGRDLAAANLSPASVTIYLNSARYFGAFLAAQGMPLVVASLTGEHIREWIRALQTEGRSAATVGTYYRSLQQFFRWAVEAGEIPESPCRRIRRPMDPAPPTPVYAAADLERLLKSCSGGTDFYSRRDFAILSLFIDTGLRLQECAQLNISDVNLDTRRVRVLGKGRRERTINLARKATRALSLYELARRKHPHADNPAYWLGRTGPLRRQGMYTMVIRRARAADLPDLHPHSLRHQFAHLFLLSGGQQRDLEELGGWVPGSKESSRYARSAAGERARTAHDTHSPLDNLSSAPKAKRQP